MLDLILLAVGFNQVGLPLLAMVALIATKVVRQENSPFADRMLLLSIAFLTMLTFHGLILAQVQWMLHALTLAILILGAVWEPSSQPSHHESEDPLRSTMMRASSYSRGDI
jgi:hypothetical protein